MRFLFVDRIVESSPGVFIRGIKHITRDDSCLTVDEQGRVCFIPSLIGEALGQLAAWNVMAQNDFSARPVAGIVDKASLLRHAYVGDTLLLESYIDAVDERAVQYHSIARVGATPVFVIEGALGPLLAMNEFIESSEVRQQYHEINRPGDWNAYSQLNMIDMPEMASVSSAIIPHMMFDRILSVAPGVELVAEKRITRAAPYFPDHFPKKPVLPMTVLLECQLNLARHFIVEAGYTNQYQLMELRKIKMNEFVLPGDIVRCFVTVKKSAADELILHCRNEVNGKRICVVDVVFKLLMGIE